jgi:hypothetical protein
VTWFEESDKKPAYIIINMSTIKQATIARKTAETDISIDLALDVWTQQTIEINTGIGFLDHVGRSSQLQPK